MAQFPKMPSFDIGTPSADARRLYVQGVIASSPKDTKSFISWASEYEPNTDWSSPASIRKAKASFESFKMSRVGSKGDLSRIFSGLQQKREAEIRIARSNYAPKSSMVKYAVLGALGIGAALYFS